MVFCAALLLATVSQLSCVSTHPTRVQRAVASDATSHFDGSYAIAALRCGVGDDQTQVQGDMLALRAAQKARATNEIETGHSHLVVGSGFALNIAGPKFTYVLNSRCTIKNSGEFEARGDDAILRKTAAQSCAGEPVALASEPELNISRVTFVGEYLVENTPTRCPDGRNYQRIWLPAQSY